MGGYFLLKYSNKVLCINFLNSMFVVEKVSGLHSPKILSSGVTPIDVNSLRIWAMNFQISFISKVIEN
jgi:hypothetical protein